MGPLSLELLGGRLKDRGAFAYWNAENVRGAHVQLKNYIFLSVSAPSAPKVKEIVVLSEHCGRGQEHSPPPRY